MRHCRAMLRRSRQPALGVLPSDATGAGDLSTSGHSVARPATTTVVTAKHALLRQALLKAPGRRTASDVARIEQGLKQVRCPLNSCR